MGMAASVSIDTHNINKVTAAPTESIVKAGEYIRAKREAKNLSLRGLAARAKISYAELSRIENGKAFPTPATLRKIAPYLSVSYDELMLSVGYGFEAGGDDSIYLDLQGNIINLSEKALKVYTKNVELFFLFEQWLDHCSLEDEMLIFQILSLSLLENECKKREKSSLTVREHSILNFMEGIRCLITSSNSLVKDTTKMIGMK